jgi:hypothetical protein
MAKNMMKRRGLRMDMKHDDETRVENGYEHKDETRVEGGV